MSDAQDRLLTVDAAAAFLTLAPQTVRNWTASGRIPVLKIGRRCVYDKEALLRWALSHKGTPAKKAVRA